MQKWVRFGATSTIVLCCTMIGFGIEQFIQGSTVNDTNEVTGGIILILFFAAVGAGCYFLFKKLSAWNRGAWVTMTNERKVLLFLLTLPGALLSIITVGIFIVIFSALIGGVGGFAKDEIRAGKRAEFRSDVEVGVRNALKRKGFR